MEVIRLSGFAENSKANDVNMFLSAAKVKKFNMYLALEKCGENRNKFSGIAFVVVYSKFDTSSILTLRNKRYQSYFIDVGRSSPEEMKNYTLYPKPDPALFEPPNLNSPIEFKTIGLNPISKQFNDRINNTINNSLTASSNAILNNRLHNRVDNSLDTKVNKCLDTGLDNVLNNRAREILEISDNRLDNPVNNCLDTGLEKTNNINNKLNNYNNFNNINIYDLNINNNDSLEFETNYTNRINSSIKSGSPQPHLINPLASSEVTQPTSAAQPQLINTNNNLDLGVDFNKPEVIKTSDVSDVLNDIEEFRNSLRSGRFTSLKDYHYGYFVKLFYIDPEVSTEEIVDFISQAANPLILFFGGFLIGPHAGKNSGEVYACFSCTLDAFSALKLTNLTLGRFKIAVVIPTKMEIDNVIFNEVQEALSLQYGENPSNMESSMFSAYGTVITHNICEDSNINNPQLASDLMETFNECISMQNSLAGEVLTTYQPDSFSTSLHDANLDVVCETLVLVKNSPLRTVRSDLIRFFDGVKIKESSIRKLNHNKDNTEWVVAFPSYQDAVKAIKKHNYKSLKDRTIELVLMT